MKIVEKGKVFGKISTINLAIIIFALALVFSAVRILSVANLHTQTQWLTVWLDADNLRKEVAFSISPGEKFISKNQKVLEILDVKIYELVSIDSLEPSKKGVILKVRLLTVVENGGNLFFDTFVKLGQTLSFQTEKTAIESKIIAIGEKAPFVEVEKRIELMIACESQSCARFDLIQAGEKKTLPNGETIAEVLDKRIEKEGRNIFVKMALKADKWGNELFFGKQKLAVLGGLKIYLDNFYFDGQIASIE